MNGRKELGIKLTKQVLQNRNEIDVKNRRDDMVDACQQLEFDLQHLDKLTQMIQRFHQWKESVDNANIKPVAANSVYVVSQYYNSEGNIVNKGEYVNK